MAIKKLTDVINGTESVKTTNTGVRKLSEVAKEKGWELPKEEVEINIQPSKTIDYTENTLKSNLDTASKNAGEKLNTLVQKRQELSNKILSEKGINGVLPTKEEANAVLGRPTISADNKTSLEKAKTLDASDRAYEYVKTAYEVNKLPEIQPYIQEANTALSDRNKALYELNKYQVENSDVSLYDKTIGRALEAIKSNLGAFDKGKTIIIDENGEEKYLPTKSNMWNQKVSNSYENEITKFLGDVLYHGTKIGSANLANIVIPGAGTAAYWSSMAADNYHEAKVEGYDDKSAALYSMIDTGLEYLTGKFLGSATKGLTGGKDSEVSKTIKNFLLNKGLKSELLTNFISNATSEGLEEFVQEYLGEINRKLTLEKNIGDLSNILTDEQIFNNALYSAAVGAATGGTLGGKVAVNENSVETNGLNSNINEETNAEEKNTQTNANTNINEKTGQNMSENESESVINFQEKNNNDYDVQKFEKSIDNAINNKYSKTNTYLGKVTNSIANKIKTLLGVNVENRIHTLSDFDIRHMINQHGNPIKEALKGQIAITKEDIKNIPNIINSPDDIVKGTDNKLGNTIRYIKKYNDNTTIVVEVVPNNSNALVIKTMWKKPSTLINSIAPDSTSETKGSDISSTYMSNSTTNDSQSQISGVLPTNSISKTNENMTRSQVRKNVIQENRELATKYLTDSANWKDKALIRHKTNTMKRNLRDMMPQVQADSIYREYFQPISKNNALMEKEINKYNEKLKNLKLSNDESIAVQMLGEKKYNPETKLTDKEVSDFIQKKKLDYNKISNSVETFRQTYDELFTKVNEVLKENGLKEIEYRKGYFPHFTEQHGKTIIGKMAEKLGWKFKDNKLPTDIAGMTEFFTPNKKWAAFTQHRTGDYTDYNALKGFDNYVRGAMNIIYHTEDIQKLRALENEIRYQHSEKGLQQEIDKINDNEEISYEEKQELIDSKFKDYNNELANFVTNLRDYTNNIAGKKSSLDRSVENLMGRKSYTVLDNVNSRVSANMVGGNIASALTNFIPLTQAWSQISTKNMLKAAAQTISNSINDDGFIDKSTYLTNRINQADKLYKTKLEKIGETLTSVFEGIDSVTSQTIVRGKYLQNIENGMSEIEALNNADEFAKDVMAGRSLGDQPTIFNSKSPITKLFTAFQLEVNNQYSYMFKDLPKDLKDKGLGMLVMAFFKMFIGAWLYNKASEEITGRKSAFSPIDIIKESYETVTNDNLSVYNKLSDVAKNISQELPFTSGVMGGGRLPINGAIPKIETTVEALATLADKDKTKDSKKTAGKNLINELKKPLFYILPPFGGGQAKKTVEGLEMYTHDTPGSYTASGRLRFPAETDALSVAQNALFGQYASKEARNYLNNNATPLTEKQQKEFKELNIPIETYRSIRKGLAQYKKKQEKIDYINKLKNINYNQKQILIKNL